MADPFQQKQDDLELEKQRNIEDAQIQLERTKETINNNIADITTDMERDIA
jgi:hypothetical protein